MCSILTEEEIKEFTRLLSPSGEKLFNIKNLEVAMKTFDLSITDADLKIIEDDLEQGNIDRETLIRKILGMAAEKSREGQDLEEVKNAAIFSFASLIDILGRALKNDEMEEIIAEDKNGRTDIKKILSQLDKDELMDVKAINDSYSSQSMDISTFRRRIICLGIITRALGENMTDEDLIDMLSDDNDSCGQTGAINYSKLLAIIEHKMRAITSTKSNMQEKNFFKCEGKCQISLIEIRRVMSKLGSVIISFGQTSSDSDFELIMEKRWDESDCELPQPIAKLIENAFGCEYDFDIFNEFHRLDPQQSGYIKAEELRKILTQCEDPLTNSEVEQIFQKVTVNEQGEFKYDDFIQQMTISEK